MTIYGINLAIAQQIIKLDPAQVARECTQGNNLFNYNNSKNVNMGIPDFLTSRVTNVDRMVTEGLEPGGLLPEDEVHCIDLE